MSIERGVFWIKVLCTVRMQVRISCRLLGLLKHFIILVMKI